MKGIKGIVFLMLCLLFLNIVIAQFSINLDLVEDSCSNGVKDNGETGIDCGGPCSPCDEEPSGSGGTSNGPSGESAVILKNYTIEVEIPQEITKEFSTENFSFIISEYEELYLVINISNPGNKSKEINISFLDMPDFLQVVFSPLNVSPNSEALLIILSDSGYYKKGDYKTELVLQSEYFEKRIKLDFKIDDISESFVELPEKIENKRRPLFILLIVSLIITAIIVFSVARLRKRI